MAEVSRKLGYRLQLQTVTHGAVAAGRFAGLAGVPQQPGLGPAAECAQSGADFGQRHQRGDGAAPGGTDLRQASPGEPLQWAGEVTCPPPWPRQLPRAHRCARCRQRTGRHPAYAVRFANADNVVTGVQWQASTFGGRLALGRPCRCSDGV